MPVKTATKAGKTATKKAVVKASAKPVKAAAKAVAKKAAAPTKRAAVVAKGASYSCHVCGLSVTVDEACGCVDVCDIVCCEQAMKPKKAKAKPAAKK